MARPYDSGVGDLVADRYELLEVLGQGGDSGSCRRSTAGTIVSWR